MAIWQIRNIDHQNLIIIIINSPTELNARGPVVVWIQIANVSCYTVCFYLQIDAASNDTELEKILDDSTNMAIINSSSWPVTKCINCRSKFQLGQTLLIEVLHKREANIRALRRGMHVLGFIKLCNEYPEKTKLLFLYTPAPLDSSRFNFSSR